MSSIKCRSFLLAWISIMTNIKAVLFCSIEKTDLLKTEEKGE